MTVDLHPSYLNGQHLSDYDFDLPLELIAQFPLAERTASRLLHVSDDVIEDLVFTDLKHLLRPGDLLVMNNTRVIKARLRGVKETGGSHDRTSDRRKHRHQHAARKQKAQARFPPDLHG